MPTSYTFDSLILAVAREALREKYPIDLRTSADGTTSTAVFGQLAYGSTGSDTEQFADQWLYWRRTTGTLSTGGTTTHSLQSGQQFTADALIGMTFRTTGGTGSGQSTTITDSDATDPCQITTAALTATSTDTTFEIIPFSSTIAPTNRSSKILSTGGLTVATGTVTVAPGVGLAATNAEIVALTDMIFCWDLHPNMIRDNINRLLRNLTYDAYIPVTMVPDGDHEDTYTYGTTASFTEWYGVDAPTTMARASTSYPFPFGRQYINVVTAATDNEGVSSASFFVDNDDSPHVAVMVQKTPAATETADFDVILYDMTNGTDLKTVTVSTQQPVMVSFQQSLASTTEEVAVRVLSNSAAATSFRVGPTMVWVDEDRYSVDSVEREGDIIGLYELPRGRTVETDVYSLSRRLNEVSFETERDDRANLLNIITPRTSRPMFMKVAKRHAELSLDTDTTYADRELIVQGVMADLEMIRAGVASARDDKNEHRSKARDYRNAFHKMRDSDDMFLKVVERDAERIGVAM